MDQAYAVHYQPQLVNIFIMVYCVDHLVLPSWRTRTRGARRRYRGRLLEESKPSPELNREITRVGSFRVVCRVIKHLGNRLI